MYLKDRSEHYTPITINLFKTSFSYVHHVAHSVNNVDYDDVKLLRNTVCADYNSTMQGAVQAQNEKD